MSQRLAHVTYKSLYDDHAAKTFLNKCNSFSKKKKREKGELIRVKVVASEGLQVTS